MSRNVTVVIFLCCLSHLLCVSDAVSVAVKSGPEEKQCANSSPDTASDPKSCSANNIEAAEERTLAIRDEFNAKGFVAVRDFFLERSDGNENDSEPLSLLSLLKDEWFDFSTNYWDRIFKLLHEKGHISEPNHVMNDEYITGKLRQPGYKEIVHRYPGRYELSLSNGKNDTNSAWLYNDVPPLQPIVDKLEPVVLSILKQHPDYKPDEVDENNKYNLLCSMLISAPNSADQKFHIDTKHLNNEFADDVTDMKDEHWPAHIINVFIPLIDITTTDLGPTELVPQSHIETRYMYNPKTRHKAKQLFQMDDPVAPLLSVGDVLMFDFRILHRGLGNVDDRNINRPLLVLAFSLPSFHDTANWPGPSIFD